MKLIIILGTVFFISGLAKAQYFHEEFNHGRDHARLKEKFESVFTNTSSRLTIKSVDENLRPNRKGSTQTLDAFDGPNNNHSLINFLYEEKISSTLDPSTNDNVTPIMHISHPEWKKFNVLKESLPEVQPQDFTFVKLELDPVKQEH